MKRQIFFVVKDIFITEFMQSADIFEKFKFAGRLLEAKQTKQMGAKKLLEVAVGHEDSRYQVVGVIIPDEEAAFLPNHAVFSTGTEWTTVKEMCRRMRARYEEA